MGQYDALPDVYEWLMPDGKLTPEGSAEALDDHVQSLPVDARVLDCSCGTGQLAVGLAQLGLDVVAADASAGMVARTQALADQHDAPLLALAVAWDDLPQHLEPSTFDLVICVGNSLCHARGAAGRTTALTAMSRLLRPGGRLVLTSRTWELVRAEGSRLDVWDHLVRRQGQDAVVVYSWQLEPSWEQEHHLEIAVARIGSDGSVATTSERLSFWPFRYEDLVGELRSVGLEVVESTFHPTTEVYKVVASDGPARV